jgi:hypothetical protein
MPAEAIRELSGEAGAIGRKADRLDGPQMIADSPETVPRPRIRELDGSVDATEASKSPAGENTQVRTSSL